MVADSLAAASYLVIAVNFALSLVVAKFTFDFWKWNASDDARTDKAHEEAKIMWDEGSTTPLFSRTYMRERSAFALIILAVSFCITSVVTRPLRVLILIFEMKPFASAGVSKFIYVLNSAMFALNGSVLLTRTWRRFVRYKYYVELKNASWMTLLDPLRSTHSTTPRVAGASSPRFADDGSVMDPMQTVVMKQMTDLGDKRETASFELPYSFWIKYKGVLTSEKGVIITSAAIGVFAVLIAAATYNNYQLVRLLMSAIMPVYTLLSFVLLYNVPESDSKIKLELTTHGFMLLGGYMSLLATTVLLSKWPKVAAILMQIIVLLLFCAILLTSFKVVPRMAEKRLQEAELPSDPLSPKSRRLKLFTEGMLKTINDAESFSQFMIHCCKEFCSENLLALLEIREFKKQLRKLMIGEDRKAEEQTKGRSASPRTSPRCGSTKRTGTRPRKNTGTSQTKSVSEPPTIEKRKSGSNEPILEEQTSGSGPHLTLTLVDDAQSSDENTRAVSEEPSNFQSVEISTSGDPAFFKKPMAGMLGTRLRGFSDHRVHTAQKLKHHESVFTQAVEEGHFTEMNIGVIGLEASEWDIHWRLSLQRLGAKSAIVSHKGLDWIGKAQALYVKYIAVDSPLQLNVGYKVRDRLELLIGPDSVVADRLSTLHLLFIFDDVISSVLSNVFDTYHRFERNRANAAK